MPADEAVAEIKDLHPLGVDDTLGGAHEASFVP
jgi:hypothetical protein